ncbi:Long-chain fatty acid transport protein 4 [Orchesella cincta]|uniref:Long-chain-fatty-acid--CoA ligase n=1 Tax=Orchesella cincta TaxID=48709 RepID=A0A1D2MKW0_ORCCI|nr:Long-chain fatty acid transport protein 4 [Orchesella cincta]
MKYVTKFLWSKRESIPIVLGTLRRDVWLLYVLYYKILLQWVMRKRKNETIAKSLDNIVNEGEGDRVCFYFGKEKWTYKQIQELSFRVSNHFQGVGLRKGDSVGLAMTNRPEMAAIWVGLGRIGVITVLINTNLRGDSLETCVSVVKCKAFIMGTEQKEAMSEIRHGKRKDLLCPNIYELDRFMEEDKKPLYQDSSFPTIDMASCLLKAGSEPTSVAKDQQPNYLDPLLYLFTSGTTGTPKAVSCSHGRLNFLASTASTINFSSNDVIYSAPPMYHLAGLFAPIWAFVYRAPAVLAVKFSASNFWNDIHFYNATVCMYVGEFCRFLHNQPVKPELEQGHKLRAFFGGGGLRPEVWAAFQKRFNVKTFVDIYASTEGNCTMINLQAKIGACGYIPIWFQPIHPIQLVKIDQITGEIIRDANTGFAIRCEDGESGELIGKIVDSVPMSRFDGYTDTEATERKIARNVFIQGDKYFRSGDSFSRDKYGYYYFQDRIGDTFRWEGENVATTLVEAVISRILQMRNNIVYGVKVEGTEGCAGMAAILDCNDENLDIQSLAEGMKKSLPRYAMPMFIRFVASNKGLDMTGTLKFQKFRLRNDGFDFEKIADPIFIYSTATESYSKMDLEKYREVKRGNYRF